ncbi:MAG TPA: hypothetical protein DCG75_06290 [Bacteroidales bacterium]|nr:hypothetical protein [Bacteroidales bacterium]
MTNGTVITTTDYAGNYIYQNNILQMINQPEGYLEPNGQGSYNYGYRLKDHLGNIRITFVDFDHNGSIVLSEITEENNYYPFGLKHQGYNNTVSSNANAVAGKFKYNGKELQDDLIGSNSLDLYDYGARFYDAALGRWHVIDPMCELARRWTPYQYAYSNPIRYIDHDGMVVDDYFNKDGIYLGKDEAPTDKVKIIDQEDWDKNKSIESDGTESIDHNSGEPLSIDHSASDISIDASLSVYEHYNPTDLPIVAQEAENGKGGMVHYAISENGITSAEIEIKLQGNKDSKISDHANEIKNLFEHEKQHNLDLKKVGIETFGKSSLQRREVRAVSHQINHSSFKGTRKGFQRSVIDYGIKFGMIQSIKSKPSTIQESKKIYRIDKQPINEFER